MGVLIVRLGLPLPSELALFKCFLLSTWQYNDNKSGFWVDNNYWVLASHPIHFSYLSGSFKALSIIIGTTAQNCSTFFLHSLMSICMYTIITTIITVFLSVQAAKKF